MLIPKKTPFLKRVSLGSVIVLIVGLTVYLLYTNFIAGRLEIIKPFTTTVAIQPLPQITPALSVDFLTKEQYRTLHQFGSLPVTVGRVGQANPFLPVPAFIKVTP